MGRKLRVRKPSCFDKKEWQLYVKAWNKSYEAANRNKIGKIDFCVDCTEEYKQEMLERGFCVRRA